MIEDALLVLDSPINVLYHVNPNARFVLLKMIA